MITAKQARELAGESIQDRVENVGKLIEEAAKKHQRKIRLNDEFWSRGGYNNSDDYKQAKKMLESYGYKVEFHYQEMSIAVDMYVTVEW